MSGAPRYQRAPGVVRVLTSADVPKKVHTLLILLGDELLGYWVASDLTSAEPVAVRDQHVRAKRFDARHHRYRAGGRRSRVRVLPCELAAAAQPA